MTKEPSLKINTCTRCKQIDLSSIQSAICLNCLSDTVERLRTRIAKLTISAAVARQSGDIIKSRVLQRQRQQVIQELDRLKSEEEAA